MNIYVGNISWGMSDQDLENLFAEHGTVTSAKIITDRMTNRSRGFGFVEMSDGAEAAIEACKLRGIKNTAVADVMHFSGEFDTILLLMNGAGMCGKLKHISDFLNHLKTLLTDDGQILVDSSDIIYMFEKPSGYRQ